MKLNVDSARSAGAVVLSKRDEISNDPTPQGFTEAQSGLVGLSITHALAESGARIRSFLERFGGELDYLGNAVIAAAAIYEATEEQGKTSFDSLDIPL